MTKQAAANANHFVFVARRVLPIPTIMRPTHEEHFDYHVQIQLCLATSVSRIQPVGGTVRKPAAAKTRQQKSFEQHVERRANCLTIAQAGIKQNGKMEHEASSGMLCRP